MYPIWEGILVHSAMYVAIVAAFHVLASHLTVAAAWFNLYLERRAVYENRPEFYEYLKRSALGLLVFAYVFGALAGVGIWQTTTAANPRGISALIHNFVLYWGSEWYMFLIDVVGIIVYYYTLGRVHPRTHLKLAWILALGASGTLAVIVGILAFKLTPGAWLQTGASLDGFYNPTYYPMLLMRFALMFTITAAWASLIAATMPQDMPWRNHIIRRASIFGLAGLIVGALIWQFWYYPSLPEHARQVMASRAVPPITYQVIVGGAVLTLLGLLFNIVYPRHQRPLIALGAMGVLFLAIFGAERTREVMRKPDIIAGYMSSNQLVIADIPARGVQAEEARLNQQGVTGQLPFIAPPKAAHEIYDMQKQWKTGKLLVLQQCASCHSVSRQTAISLGRNELRLRPVDELLRSRGATTPEAIEAYLNAIGGFPYMHPVKGTQEERAAMAAYLYTLVQEGEPPAALARR
ncbi:MAG: cytochrome c [Armatimonadetes bacterium]|nr:MAG: cytochrome c [Armatimonadota bacterium]